MFYIEPTDRPGVNKAYWGPLGLTGSPQKALSVNMGTRSNVTSINFQYNSLKPSVMVGSVQDRNTNTKIPITTFSSLRPPLSEEPVILVKRSNVRIRQFRASGLNAQQAFVRAQAETDKLVDALTANGGLDTVQYGDVLRARKLVGLRGAGHAHDGLYYVKSVTHRIKLGDYKQTFTITREGFGSSTRAVPP